MAPGGYVTDTSNMIVVVVRYATRDAYATSWGPPKSRQLGVVGESAHRAILQLAEAQRFLAEAAMRAAARLALRQLTAPALPDVPERSTVDRAPVRVARWLTGVARARRA